MGRSRQTANLWWYLFGFYTHYKPWRWRFPEFIKSKLWTSSYFWQDSFLTHWNRMLGCKLTKHKTQIIYDDNDVKREFCFKCYRNVSPKSK